MRIVAGTISKLTASIFALYFGASQASDMEPLLERGAFGETYEALQNIEHEAFRAQMLATYYTLVGRQDLVFEMDAFVPLPRDCSANGNDIDGTFLSADKWASNAFTDQKIVMFNENHFHIASRVWVHSMLAAFKAQGFTHLGFEALIPGDTTPETGFYTYEPTFKALIRDAQAMGFEVFGYESTKAVPEGASPLEVREQTQAENIAQAIADADESARFLIFAGWGHIAKVPVGDNQQRWMAARFHDLTEIEPYAVDMVTCIFTAGSDALPTQARILLDSDQHPIVAGQMSGRVDAQLHLPLPPQTAATGFYRQALGPAVMIPEELLSADEPRLVRAFRASSEAIPYDQVMIHAGEALPLYLLPGFEYDVKSLNAAGEVQAQKTLRVE
ncbi:MAG: hypothetical protein JJU10_00115 [Idiomarina sp.]|nr:hypothetical protein [Idiomarina sp.]